MCERSHGIFAVPVISSSYILQISVLYIGGTSAKMQYLLPSSDSLAATTGAAGAVKQILAAKLGKSQGSDKSGNL